jgi:TPR repeat protein
MTAALMMGSVSVVLADVEAGLKAAQAGDFVTALREWKPLAEQGDIDAQFNLGIMYNFGRGVSQEYKIAAKWYRKAAEQGDARAQFNLGMMYRKGEGVSKDFKEAVKWCRKAAEQGYAKAQSRLGIFYENGQGVSQDYRKAVKWFRKAAEQGEAYAQFNLGYLYSNGKSVSKDFKEAVKWYRKAAEQGHREAQHGLGYMYQSGRGVSQDYKIAAKWFRKAADQGVASAQSNLGYMYRIGLGVSQDAKEAVKWYRKAAVQGKAKAQYNLGLLYNNGEGVARDYKEAAKWYHKAAEQEFAEAQDKLALLYWHGRGVVKDYKEAVKWYHKAAEQGHSHAQGTLGFFYGGGYGVAQDYKEAVKWYRKAAEKGGAEAQLKLGFYYEKGLGVAQDYEEAVKWYRKAAEQDYSDALSRFEKLLKKIAAAKPASAVGVSVPKEIQMERREMVHRTQEALQLIGLYSGTIDGLVGAKTKAATQQWQKRNGYPVKDGLNEQQLAKLEQEANKRVADKKAISKPFQSHPDDIAIVIGNSNYKKLGKDIPNVSPAYSDADAFKEWLMAEKGLREGNIIFIKDATGSQLVGAFGNERSHKGQLFNWTKPGISNVYVYYSGHGAPGGKNQSAMLVPADSSSSNIELTGYSLETLYKNLSQIPAKSITLVLESCFSGASQNGYVINKTSGILISPKMPTAPKNITVISAGQADQVASWEKDDSHSLFTKYFLSGMKGEADKSPYGNSDGKVGYDELEKYLGGTMTYFARRYYGRDQVAQFRTWLR